MSEAQSDSNSTGYYFGNPSTKVQHSLAFSGPMFVLLMVMMVTLVVVIVLGNALVILAFKVDKSLRRQCNYYFLNLAISDFLVGESSCYLWNCRMGRKFEATIPLCAWLLHNYMFCFKSFSRVLNSFKHNTRVKSSDKTADYTVYIYHVFSPDDDLQPFICSFITLYDDYHIYLINKHTSALKSPMAGNEQCVCVWWP